LIESSRNFSGGFFIAPSPVFLMIKTGYYGSKPRRME
jgi:hypothetical protein